MGLSILSLFLLLLFSLNHDDFLVRAMTVENNFKTTSRTADQNSNPQAGQSLPTTKDSFRLDRELSILLFSMTVSITSFPFASGAAFSSLSPVAAKTPWMDNIPSDQTMRSLQQSGRGLKQLTNYESPFSQAVREIYDLRELQDQRLELCAERGPYWEQCLFGGDNDGDFLAAAQLFRKNKKKAPIFDYQLVSPEGALEPKKQHLQGSKIPTW